MRTSSRLDVPMKMRERPALHGHYTDFLVKGASTIVRRVVGL
jgi:hypothetical protein